MMRMFRISMMVIALLIVQAALLAGASYAGEKKFTLKFNTLAGPKQPQVKGLELFASEVEKLSKGRIEVKIFHSGQLGNQQIQQAGVMRGTIDMTFTAPNSLAQFDKRLGIFGAAYLFRDLGHMYRVMEGPVGAEYFDRLAQGQGVRPLDVWYLGTRQLNLVDMGEKVVRTPLDMKGVKLRMPNSPQWIALGRALGASPTPLGFGEVYLALKTGVVDGQDNPLPTNKAQKFYEVTKYIVLTNHQIGMIWPSINERLWNKMPHEYQGWIIKALRTAREYQNSIVLDGEASLVEEFENEHGMTIVRDPDRKAFMRHALQSYKNFESDWGKGMYEKIQSSK
jgi:tripartite ATP-independent transporter DctP family solute receptor